MTRLLVVDLNACRRPQQEPYRLLAREHGFDVTLAVPTAWREPFGTAQAEAGEATQGFKLVALTPIFNGRYHRLMLRGLERLIAQVQPDHLWLHAEPENFLAWQGLRSAARACPAARTWLVSSRNIGYPRLGLPYRLPGLHQGIQEASLAAAPTVLCYNHDAQRLMAQEGFAVAPVRMGVHLGLFKPGSTAAARKALGLPIKGLLFGFAGRCLHEKGGADLVAAAARVPGASVLVLGNGPALPAWQAQAAELGVAFHVRALPHEQMPVGLRAMDALVLPSHTTAAWVEQFGRVLIEAMACGVPVIGSDSGEIPRVIGKAGLIFAEGDVSALARCLQGMDNAVARKRYAALGLERCRQWGWHEVAKGLASTFDAMPAMPRPTAGILGLPLWQGSQAELLHQVQARLQQGQGGLLFYANAHLANLAASDGPFRALLRQATWIVPDGAGVVLASRLLGRPVRARMPLGDLLGPLVDRAARTGRRIFLWGGEPGLAERTGQALGALHPRARLAGCAHGFHDAPGQQAVIARLKRLRPGLVVLGMGSPQQEALAARLAEALPGAVIAVAGNAMTFFVGHQQRAPQWMQTLALEWFWRLVLEPKRLWRRYLLGNPQFLMRALWQRLGGRP